jgi:hypothetical protein
LAREFEALKIKEFTTDEKKRIAELLIKTLVSIFHISKILSFLGI